MNPTEALFNAEQSCNEFDFNLAIFLIVLFVVSMCGNSLVIAIFSRRKFTPAILLFLVLATLDVSLLLSQFLITTMPTLCKGTTVCGAYADAKGYLDAYAFPVVVIIYCTSTWVVVVMAFNRYFAITKPLVHHRIITVKYISIELVVIFVLCVAYNIPRFFEYNTDISQNSTSATDAYFSSKENQKHSTLYTNKYYQVYYKILSFLILVLFIPLVMLTYFTFKLIKEIKRSNARRKELLKGSYFAKASNNLAAEEQSITITLIVVVIAFILFRIPIGINRILQLVFVYKYGSIECPAINNTTYYVSRVFNSFAEINAAFNCIIYGVTSPQFRRDLQNLCTFRKTAPTLNFTSKTKILRCKTSSGNSNKPEHNNDGKRKNLPKLNETSV